jgi:nitroimidazol reductase NimA-like FMN-containing flavoprotein (pyridoxamine 5'-phosphate oxidase superfamily)
MSTEQLADSSTEPMSDDQLRAFLNQQGVGTLVLPAEDLPYAVPMSFGFDGDSTLYFLFLLFGEDSRKQTLCERAGRARFVVYAARSMHDWQSASLVGPIGAVPEEDWEALRTAMENAWHPSVFSSASPTRGVEGYRLEVESWTGIQHTP